MPFSCVYAKVKVLPVSANIEFELPGTSCIRIPVVYKYYFKFDLSIPLEQFAII